MPRITRGANSRSRRPPIPPVPSQVVEIRTRGPPSWGVTVNVMTMLERRRLPGAGHREPSRPSRISARAGRYSEFRRLTQFLPGQVRMHRLAVMPLGGTVGGITGRNKEATMTAPLKVIAFSHNGSSS